MIEICNADENHISVLAEIERAAAEMFSEIDLPTHLRSETISEQEHLAARRQGLLLVAVENGFKPVGFSFFGRDNMPTFIRSIFNQEQEKGYNLQRRVAMGKSVKKNRETL